MEAAKSHPMYNNINKNTFFKSILFLEDAFSVFMEQLQQLFIQIPG